MERKENQAGKYVVITWAKDLTVNKNEKKSQNNM